MNKTLLEPILTLKAPIGVDVVDISTQVRKVIAYKHCAVALNRVLFRTDQSQVHFSYAHSETIYTLIEEIGPCNSIIFRLSGDIAASVLWTCTKLIAKKCVLYSLRIQVLAERAT
ncbi:hypothetical protein RM543_06415 [Roseicyclus sp. F158]|uniref:Uncharacterized protein n=1 Tax=Tropicimonas omnivorans TaxID=3075590 RepID=A0ABU3DF12_9RHOB|nr:hypothetical protein [Roseicyclus sp. F158]MDT0682310.1 hypothetical protein [Roseicyclus sp. F158]